MAAAVEITRMDHTAAEFRVLAAKSRDSPRSRRLLAIAILLDGASREDAARQAGMDRQTLRDWVHRYNESGPDGLISRTAPGPQPRLNEAEMETFRDLVIAGPDVAIHGVALWLPSICATKLPAASVCRSARALDGKSICPVTKTFNAYPATIYRVIEG